MQQPIVTRSIGVNFKNGSAMVLTLEFPCDREGRIFYNPRFVLDNCIVELVWMNEKNGNVIYREVS